MWMHRSERVFVQPLQIWCFSQVLASRKTCWIHDGHLPQQGIFRLLMNQEPHAAQVLCLNLVRDLFVTQQLLNVCCKLDFELAFHLTISEPNSPQNGFRTESTDSFTTCCLCGNRLLFVFSSPGVSTVEALNGPVSEVFNISERQVMLWQPAHLILCTVTDQPTASRACCSPHERFVQNGRQKEQLSNLRASTRARPELNFA